MLTASVLLLLLALGTLVLPVPLWLHRYRGAAHLPPASDELAALPAPSHFRDLVGVVGEAWVVRELVRDAAKQVEECLAVWPYIWLLTGRVSRWSGSGSANWASISLDRLYSRATDARASVWQWLQRFDAAPGGHRAQLEQAGLELDAARMFVTNMGAGVEVTATSTQIALIPVQAPRRQDLRRLRDQLRAVVASFDRLEAGLRAPASSPYR
ncbi:MAG: hypothetical protein V3V08_12705 [Nannocystaceae bacterium]